MKKGGANTDVMRLQQQIMQNSQGIQDYMQDLNSWMGDMNKNEKAVAQAVSSKQVSCLSLFDMHAGTF